jgi:hypothetical protein
MLLPTKRSELISRGLGSIKSMRLQAFALLLIGSSGLDSQAPPPSTPAIRMWIQGLAAHKESYDRLMAKLKSSAAGPLGDTPGAVPRSIGCPVALESALAVALTDAHFTNDSNEDFHLVFHGTTEKEYLDVSYTYNRRGALVMTAIHRLPTGWTVGFQSGEASLNKFMLVTDDATGCIFEFDSTDPFASKAVAQQP